MLRFQQHYNINREKQLIKYYNLKPKGETIVVIKFKFNCKLCDFYTNHKLLYRRHLCSNNHYNRMNQF